MLPSSSLFCSHSVSLPHSTMPSTHPRSEPAIEHRFTKKLKTSHVNKEQPRSISSYFADGVLDATHAVNLGAKYRESNPFLYAVVDKLFQDDLLSQVKDECIGELSFTEKETDIYKVGILVVKHV